MLSVQTAQAPPLLRHRPVQERQYRWGRQRGNAGGKGGKGDKGKGGTGNQESASAKKVRELEDERGEAAKQRKIQRLEADKKKEKWGAAGGADDEAEANDDEGVVDVAKINEELEERKGELKTWNARLKKRVEGSADHDKAKAKVAKADAEIEECKTKLRDARTPTQQMVGKCKRSNKLAELCVDLAQKMLDEQRDE